MKGVRLPFRVQCQHRQIIHKPLYKTLMFTLEEFNNYKQRCKSLDPQTENRILMDAFTHILDPEWAVNSWDIPYNRKEAFLWIAAIYDYSGWATDSIEEMLNKHITEPSARIKIANNINSYNA